MHLVGDLIARDRRSRDAALVTEAGRERTYHDLITNAYKAANVFRYLGAREGATIAVEPRPTVHTILGFLGAAGLGAAVRFDPHAGIAAGDRVVLADVSDEGALDPAPGTNLAVFGGPPDRAATTHWEQELWSENPGMPPSSIDRSDPVLRESEHTVSHATALSAAASLVDSHGIDSETRVVLRADFSRPAAVIVGLIAPLLVVGAVVLTDTTVQAADPRGDIAVVPDRETPVPEQRVVAFADVLE